MNPNFSSYQAGLHDLQALLTLTRARLSLPPAASRDDWEALLKTGQWADPYTGGALTIDKDWAQPTIAARKSPGWPKAMMEVIAGRLIGQAPPYTLR